MNVQYYADFLLAHMDRAKYASGRKFINCKCPECGDGKHRDSAHMYISLPWNEDEPSWFYCHICHNSSIINHKKLLEWNIYDPIIAQELQELNTKASRLPRRSKYFNNEIFRVYHNMTSNGPMTEIKRKFVSDRVGVDLSIKELSDLKIILNLNDLLMENRIQRLTRDQNIVNQLSDSFVGFLSIDNGFLNMRRTCNEGIVNESIDKRYINYNIFNKFDTTQRFYTIPTVVDLNTPVRHKLHISEGPFDILSVYLNLRNREQEIYTCVAGSNYISVIMFFLIDMALPNLELHFYPDNDKYGTDDVIRDIVSRIPDPTVPVYIHRNTFPGEKDFGVPANRIRETVYAIRK